MADFSYLPKGAQGALRLLQGRPAGMPPAPSNSFGDLKAGLDALTKGDGLDMNAVANDPILQLENQRISEMPTGSGDITAALREAAAANAYGGPSLDQLRAYGNEGQARISNLYAQLGAYLQGRQSDTANQYAAGEMRTGAGYENAQRDIAAAQQQAQDAVQGAVSGGVGKEAAAEATAAATAAIQRQQALNTSNKANALGNMQSMATGKAALYNDLMSGAQQEKTAQSGLFGSQVNSLIGRAQAEMAAANQRTAMAQESIRQKAAEQSATAQQKANDARYKALEDAIKRAQSGQKSTDNLSGIKGVLAYAMRAGNPQAAKNFMDMLNQSRVSAAQWNNRIATDPGFAATNKRTTPDEQLQMLLGNVGGTREDLSTDINPRGDILNLIRNTPELAGLKKYIISDPESAIRAGEYIPAFGVSQQEYEKAGGGGGGGGGLMGGLKGGLIGNAISPLAALGGAGIGALKGMGVLGGGGKNQQDYRNQFTPFVNLTALRHDPQATQAYYNYFNSNPQDLMMNLFNIYQGKYGQGSF
jgi:hypothetical protein